MKADDVYVLRSIVSIIYGYKERILHLFGVDVSVTDIEDHFQSNDIENADPGFVTLRLMSDSSQENLDQAKNYIASLTVEDRDKDLYTRKLDRDLYRMILQRRDAIEQTSQAILNFDEADDTNQVIVHGQTKSVALARSLIENMVLEKNKSYCEVVRTRGGMNAKSYCEVVRTRGRMNASDVERGGSEVLSRSDSDVVNENYSPVESHTNEKSNSDFSIPLATCDDNLQTDSGPSNCTGGTNILFHGFDLSDAAFDDVIIESEEIVGDHENVEGNRLNHLESDNLCMLQSRTSDIDEEIVKLTRFNLTSPVATYDELCDTDDLSSDPDYSSKVQFALKLGYSEDQLKMVIVKLGSCAEQNELLSELIKLDKCVKPKQDVERTVSDESDKTNSGEFYGSMPTSPYEKSSDDDFSVEPSLTRASHLLSENFRPVVIDGSNVAMSHGDKETFSCRGIKLAVDWFRQRGHRDVTVFVPQWRKETSRPNAKITDQQILAELEEDKVLVFTPARRIGGRRVICYDDRYVLKLAADTGGIVVSNDNYRDLIEENAEFRKVVEERLLMYSFVNDRFMPPDDPLGRNGPKLDNFLCKEPTVPEPLPPLCPYGSKKCTYGNKCKYYHPERGNQPQKTITEELAEKLKQKKQEVKDRGSKNPEGDKKKPLTKKPKPKVSLQRTKSLVPPSMIDGSPDEKLTNNRHSADLSEVAVDVAKSQDESDFSTEKLEKTKTYNDKLDEYRKLVEKAEQEEQKRKEETKRNIKESDATNVNPNTLCCSLSASRELLGSRSPSPHQRSCSPSQLKPQEQFLSGHLLLAKKLSDEAAEKKPRFRSSDERETIKTPPVDAPHQPSALQYRCNSPLAQPTPLNQGHNHHKQLTNQSKQGQISPSCTQPQPQRKHQSLSRQLSLQGNQDPRVHRHLQQQSSYDPRMLSRQHYKQNFPEFDKPSVRHTALQRQCVGLYGEQEHQFTSAVHLQDKVGSQQYLQPFNPYGDSLYGGGTDEHFGSMEHPALSRMQSAPEVPQLRNAVAPAKIGHMVRQNSNSDTQLHVLGGDPESPYFHHGEIQHSGDKLVYGDNQGSSFQVQTPHYGRSVSMLGHPTYSHSHSQPQKLRAGNTTWSFGGDVINRKSIKRGDGHIASGHQQFIPFQHQFPRTPHPRFQEMSAPMHESRVDHSFQKGILSQREEDVWRPQRNTSPSNFVTPAFQQVDTGYGSTSPIPRGPGRPQNQQFSLSGQTTFTSQAVQNNMYGSGSPASFSQSQQYLPNPQPHLIQSGVNQPYHINNPSVSAHSCEISTTCVGVISKPDVQPLQLSDDAPIHPGDPRYNVYYHLCGLFPEPKVRAVMNSHPEETDAKELCAYIIGAK